MILENGVVRTMEPSLPQAAALAVAGPLVAGGVGVHETALPTPDRVDLNGLCVLPAFTDSHVHFPTWSLSQRDVRLEGAASLEAARDGIRLANRRGVAAVHDKDGWLGAAAIFGRIQEREGLTLRVWQSLPADKIGALADLRLRSRVGDDFLRLGYLKCFMDGTL